MTYEIFFIIFEKKFEFYINQNNVNIGYINVNILIVYFILRKKRTIFKNKNRTSQGGTQKEFMKMYLESFKLDGRLKNIGEAKKRVKVFFDTLKQVIDKDEKVIFKDWGKFEIEHREQRIYGNPRTKERIVIPAKKVLKFTVGKKFAERVKNS